MCLLCRFVVFSISGTLALDVLILVNAKIVVVYCWNLSLFNGNSRIRFLE